MNADPTRLSIETFCLGEWMTNCYVVHRKPTECGCWIVDAGYEPEPMIDYIRERGLTPQRVVLTHGHLDHIAGLRRLREEWPDLPIMIHETEWKFPRRPVLNLSALLAEPVVAPDPTEALADELDLEGLRFEIRHTPGHSPGGVTLYQPESGVALVGDTLFAGSIGRADFPGSDPAMLEKSIREQLYSLPDETRVLPGHGPATTIGRERATNPFVRD